MSVKIESRPTSVCSSHISPLTGTSSTNPSLALGPTTTRAASPAQHLLLSLVREPSAAAGTESRERSTLVFCPRDDMSYTALPASCDEAEQGSRSRVENSRTFPPSIPPSCPGFARTLNAFHQSNVSLSSTMRTAHLHVSDSPPSNSDLSQTCHIVRLRAMAPRRPGPPPGPRLPR